MKTIARILTVIIWLPAVAVGFGLEMVWIGMQAGMQAADEFVNWI